MLEFWKKIFFEYLTNRSVLVLFGKIKYDFDKHQYLHKKWKYEKTKHTMKKFMILALQRYHFFQLNIKNSQSYDHFKKSSKKCVVFFCPLLYICKFHNNIFFKYCIFYSTRSKNLLTKKCLHWWWYNGLNMTLFLQQWIS